MRFRKRHSSEDKTYRQTYMKGKLEITITPLGNVDGLGHDTMWENCRTGHMNYRTDSGTLLSRDIPHDLYSILTDLALALDEEVAKIIYEEMEHHFNELLCYIQREGTLAAEGDLPVANVTQVRFPSVESFRAELSMIRNSNQRLTPRTDAITRNDIPDTFGSLDNDFRNNTYGRYTRTSTYTDYTRVLTADEYEELRQNGGLNSGEVYLIVN